VARTSAPQEERAQRAYTEILDQEIESALEELRRPTGGLAISGFSAGLDISFSLLLMATMTTLVSGRLPEPVSHLLIANMYAVGFIFVILGRSELFTEHTTRAALPVLARRASVAQLGRVWGVVYLANLLGAAAATALIVAVGPPLGIIDPAAFGEIALPLVEHPSWLIVLSAVLAGWLMGLLSWLTAAARDTISQIFFVWLVTGAIGVCGLHHSIAGASEVLAAVYAGQGVTLAGWARFLLWATLGNAIGGLVFVAIIKYSHAVQSDAS
jgi:formate/nitrite transporter FocA (FNT family)